MTLKSKNTQETVEETTEETTTTEVTVRESAAPPAPAVLSSIFITNPIFQDAVAGAKYRTFPSVVASGGSHMQGENDLGKELKFQAILVKAVKKVIPGSNDDEASDYFAVSEDGESVNDGRSLEEALQDAKDAGYDKAKIKDYLDVIVLVTECVNKDFIGETLTLQLSPSSCYSWEPLEGQCKMKAALGKLEAVPIAGNPDLGTAVVFTSTATNSKKGTNNWTKFVFTL